MDDYITWYGPKRNQDADGFGDGYNFLTKFGHHHPNINHNGDGYGCNNGAISKTYLKTGDGFLFTFRFYHGTNILGDYDHSFFHFEETIKDYR